MVARAISQNIFWLRYLGDLGERPEREQVRVVFYLGPHQHYEYQHHRSVNVIMNKSSKRQSGRWMSVDVGGCWFQSSYAQEVALLLRSSHNIFETNRQFFRKKKTTDTWPNVSSLAPSSRQRERHTWHVPAFRRTSTPKPQRDWTPFRRQYQLVRRASFSPLWAMAWPWLQDLGSSIYINAVSQNISRMF